MTHVMDHNSTYLYQASVLSNLTYHLNEIVPPFTLQDISVYSWHTELHTKTSIIHLESIRKYCLLAKLILPFHFSPLHLRMWRVELWYTDVGDIFPR